MTTVRYIHIMLLAAGLGLISFFSFVPVPAAATLLPSRKPAETLGNLSLRQRRLSYMIVLLMIICGVWIAKGQVKSIRYAIKTNSFVIVLFLVTLCWALIVSPTRKGVRMTAGPRAAAATHPPRLPRNREQKVSVWPMSLSLFSSAVQPRVALAV